MEWDDRLAPHGQVLGPRQLRLDHDAAALAAQALEVNLPLASLGRIAAVTAGAAGAWHAALSVAAAARREALGAAGATAGSGGGPPTGLARGPLSPGRAG